MVKISGDYGSQQTANGVVELLSPMHFIWRRALEWGGTTALGSDGTSVTFTNTNLPKEGELVMINSAGKAAQNGNLSVTDSGTTSLALVWTGYAVADAGAVDTITVVDGAYYLFEVSSDRVSSSMAPAAGYLAFYDASQKKFYGTDSAEGVKGTYRVGVCEGTTTRGGATYYRLRWGRTPCLTAAL